MEIKNPGRRFSFLNAPGDVGKPYHIDVSLFKNPLSLDDAKTLNNLEIVGQLWVSLRVFELTLRSFINQVIVYDFDDQFWWRNKRLIHSYHFQRFERAKNVEGLTLSSLTLLFSASYRELWSDVFHPAMQNPENLNRKVFHANLEYVRIFRNIVAHHEVIKKKYCLRALENMHSLTLAIDPYVADWLLQKKQEIEELMNKTSNEQSW